MIIILSVFITFTCLPMNGAVSQHYPITGEVNKMPTPLHSLASPPEKRKILIKKKNLFYKYSRSQTNTFIKYFKCFHTRVLAINNINYYK